MIIDVKHIYVYSSAASDVGKWIYGEWNNFWDHVIKKFSYILYSIETNTGWVLYHLSESTDLLSV